jgi:hypothetical protein
MKTGFAGDDHPRSVCPTIIGEPRYSKKELMIGVDHKSAYVGDEAMRRRGVLNLNNVVVNKQIPDWCKYIICFLGIKCKHYWSTFFDKKWVSTQVNIQCCSTTCH